MNKQDDLTRKVLDAVEELTEQGSVGFYASAIVAITAADPMEVTRLLLRMVEDQTLEPRYEIRCPDNGRRIASYQAIDDIPFGDEIQSDRCDSPDPVCVEETDVYVRFSLNRNASSALRRRKHRDTKSGEPLGKAQVTGLRQGLGPKIDLRRRGRQSRR